MHIKRDEASVGTLMEKLVEVVEVVVRVGEAVVSCATEPLTTESKTMADPRVNMLVSA